MVDRSEHSVRLDVEKRTDVAPRPARRQLHDRFNVRSPEDAHRGLPIRVLRHVVTDRTRTDHGLERIGGRSPEIRRTSAGTVVEVGNQNGVVEGAGGSDGIARDTIGSGRRVDDVRIVSELEIAADPIGGELVRRRRGDVRSAPRSGVFRAHVACRPNLDFGSGEDGDVVRIAGGVGLGAGFSVPGTENVDDGPAGGKALPGGIGYRSGIG